VSSCAFEVQDGGVERDPSRGRRIAPSLVAFAVVLAAVWLVATFGPFRSEPEPAGTEGSRTGAPSPAETPVATDLSPPSISPRVGFVGLPPEEATPSEPRRGELVLSYFGERFTNWYQVWVYADGRLIWQREGNIREGANELATGFLEQRLTRRGVRTLQRRGSAEEALFGFPWRPPYPASWLAPDAWADRTIRPFVASRYAICYQGLQRPIEPSRILDRLPGPVADLLREHPFDVRSVEGWLRGFGGGCSSVSTEHARAVADALEDAGFGQNEEFQEAYALTYYFEGEGVLRNAAIVRFDPILPHGELGCTSCG
jgi:hypothetical protein